VIAHAHDAHDALDTADAAQLLDRQHRVLELLAGGAGRGEVLDAVTLALEELIPGSRCSVLVLDAAGGTLHHGAAPSLPAAYSAAIDGLPIGHDAGSCGAAAYLDRAVVAEDIAHDVRWDRFRALAMPHGLGSCWSSPIHGRDGVLGTFAVYHARPHRPDDRERRLVARFTDLAAVALEHDRLHAARAARREAELAARVAEDASRAKSLLLSTLSHELRTPLQAIIGFSELLGTLDLPPARREAALGHIDAAAHHVLDLVGDVLDLARLEARALPLASGAVDLATLVHEVLDLLEPLADRRGIRLDTDLPDAGGPTACADPRRVRQVLINLVTNGVRHNHVEGWVRVGAREADREVVLTVADGGPGIPAALAHRLFEPFAQLDGGAEEDAGGGTGLGLALVRGLVEAMAGTVTVDSAPGAGTTATVRLPGAPGHVVEDRSRDVAAPGGPGVRSGRG
jgi:two-component system cell cycle sensor histidine kinase PleC